MNEYDPVKDSAVEAEIEAAPDMAQLQSELSELRSQIELLVGHAAQSGKAQLLRARRDASDKVGELAEEGGRIIESVEHDLRLAEAKTAERIREAPFQSVAIAAAFGFLFALIVRR